MNEESLFAAALEKQTPAERQAFLEAACAGQAALRQRLERLLAADGHAAGILERGPAADPLRTELPEPEFTTARVFAGRFKLREKLGEGGMGEVWVADQIEPVQRRVALKVVRADHDSARMLARFEQERQALALFDHPNIAKVLDAGIDDAGRPFFAMELIKGVPITKYCDDAKLTPRQRLELFVPVCQAVQHAHQKGVIHRDLKPSNILVGLYDGVAVPKVIDFGVAKATGPRLTEQSVYTEVGALIGTLEYMSPEQAEMNNLDIDTRTDIYSLGIVLYELLTGTVPFSRKEQQSVAFIEMLRIIKEVDPPRPSTRLTTSQTLETVAVARQTEPKKLIALVRGELDWIVLKSLEKDRKRRYETANELAADLQRYLADEPVAACPPSAGYRFRKLVRRNKGPVLAASLVFLALVGGIVGTSIGYFQAEQARSDAAKRAEGELKAKQSAEKRLAQVEKGIDLLGSIFDDLDPQAERKEGRPLRMILGDRLDKVAAELEGEAVGDPLVVARLQERLARTYIGLGQPKKAEPLVAKALATRQTQLGPDDSLTLKILSLQARVYHLTGRPREAVKLLEQVRDVQAKIFGTDDLETLTTLNELGWVYWLAGDPKKSIALLEQVRDERIKKLGEDDEATIATMNNLAAALQAAERGLEAVAVAEKVLVARRKKYTDDHPVTLSAINSLGRAYAANPRTMKKALDLYERALDAILPKLGRDHPQTLAIQHNLVRMYRVFGKIEKAIALGEVVRERRLAVNGARDQTTIDAFFELASAYEADNQFKKALSLFEQMAQGLEKLDFAQINAGLMIEALCECHEDRKQFDQAEIWRRKWLAVVKTKDGPDSLAYARELRKLGRNLLCQQKFVDAEICLGESSVLFQKNPPKAWITFSTQTLLGAALLGQRKYAEAEPLVTQGFLGMKQLEQDASLFHYEQGDRQELIEAADRLVQLYEAWGKKDEADRWRKEGDAVKARRTK
jgi:eukaryotic-like serine/threonine-protein kinase